MQACGGGTMPAAPGQKVTLHDGTVVDADSLIVGDVVIGPPWHITKEMLAALEAMYNVCQPPLQRCSEVGAARRGHGVDGHGR